MNFAARYRLSAIAAGVLILGVSGCGSSTETPSSASTTQAQEIIPAASIAASEGTPATPVSVDASETPATSLPETKQPHRNPFRPPLITSRTLMPQQAESGDIRLLGIAKKDSQHIALLETAGDFRKAIPGDVINDWEVLSVTESETTLRRGLEQMSLRIR